MRAIAPLKARVHYLTAPYFAQTWSFFAPYLPRESRVANLYLRVARDGELREIGPLPLRALLAEQRLNPFGAQSRAAGLTTLFEFNLWNPSGPLRRPFARMLSGAAAGVARRQALGEVVAVRGTIMERRIVPPGQAEDPREALVLNTGWLPFEREVASW